MNFDPALAFLSCPHCDTSTVPQAMGRGWYHCDVCGKSFESGIPSSASRAVAVRPSRRSAASTGSPLLANMRPR